VFLKCPGVLTEADGLEPLAQTSHELRLWQSIQGKIAVTKITTKILFLKAATFVGKRTTRVIRSAFDDPFAQTFPPHLTGQRSKRHVRFTPESGHVR
jgi:hypothetical protein